MDVVAALHPLFWKLEAASNYVNHATTYELVELPGTAPLLERIEAAYPEHAPCELVAVDWRTAIRAAIGRVALDENQLAAERFHTITRLIEQVWFALEAWLGAYDVASYAVHHRHDADGAGLFGYISDATHALVLRRRGDHDQDQPPAMYLFGLGWSD